MSAIPAGGRLLDGTHALPPKEQRILAPSTVQITDSNMGAKQCVCALTVVDVVNITVYHVPMTQDMIRTLVRDLMHAGGIDTMTINTETNDG